MTNNSDAQHARALAAGAATREAKRKRKEALLRAPIDWDERIANIRNFMDEQDRQRGKRR